MSSKTFLNADENCDDLHVDAVPDQPRKYDKEKNSSIPDKSEEVSSKRLPQGTNTVPKVLKSPNESKSSQNHRQAPASKARKSAPQQQQGASYVTINISNTRDVHIGNTFNIRPNETAQKPWSSPPKETPEIKKLRRSSEPITLDDISLVSTHVGMAWRDMGRYLKYTGGQLQQFDADYGREGLKEVVYQLLLDWKQVNTSDATVGILCSALWESNQFDAVTEWVNVRA